MSDAKDVAFEDVTPILSVVDPVADWANNFMIHVEVGDADAAEPFGNAHVMATRTEPWGYRVTYVQDPSGVLLRFSQPLARP